MPWVFESFLRCGPSGQGTQRVSLRHEARRRAFPFLHRHPAPPGRCHAVGTDRLGGRYAWHRRRHSSSIPVGRLRTWNQVPTQMPPWAWQMRERGWLLPLRFLPALRPHLQVRVDHQGRGGVGHPPPRAATIAEREPCMWDTCLSGDVPIVARIHDGSGVLWDTPRGHRP